MIGGTNSELHIGDFVYTPVVEQGYYSVFVTGMSIGSNRLSLSRCIEMMCEVRMSSVIVIMFA